MKAGCKILFLFVVTAFLFSCKSAVVATKDKNEHLSAAEIVEKANVLGYNYRYASYKFSAEYSKNGEQSSLSGLLRIERDSTIWLSLRSFNIEGVRALIQRDTIKVIDRINSVYYEEDIAALAKIVNISIGFDELQAILMNEYFCYSAIKNFGEPQFSACHNAKFHCINASSPATTAQQTTRFLPETMKVKNTFIEEPATQRSAFIEYENFTDTDFVFPQQINIELTAANTELAVKLHISEFEVQNELSFPFKISSKYKKLRLNEKNN